MKLWPLSMKASTIRRDSDSSVPHSVLPNVIVPRQARETLRPDRPIETTLMTGQPNHPGADSPKGDCDGLGSPHRRPELVPGAQIVVGVITERTGRKGTAEQ